MAGILACECDLCRSRRSPFSAYSLYFAWTIVSHTSQAAKDVRASQDILIDVFERIEMFFRRLEVYTELRATGEMMEIIVQIMVEVLSILGIATKEIKQGRMSKYSVYKCVTVD